MDKKVALDVIKQACANVVGNLKDHETIQGALKVIEDEIAQRNLQAIQAQLVNKQNEPKETPEEGKKAGSK